MPEDLRAFLEKQRRVFERLRIGPVVWEQCKALPTSPGLCGESVEAAGPGDEHVVLTHWTEGNLSGYDGSFATVNHFICRLTREQAEILWHHMEEDTKKSGH